MLEKNKTIAFAGCKDTTLECIKGFLALGYEVDWLITINPSEGKKNRVAGYYDLRQFAQEKKIRVYKCDSYSLKSVKDRRELGKIEIDLLLVIGWQRLIPEWLLKKLTIGAFGMHGSSQALPFGRGRSPMNWSLIQGRKVFITNLFKYNQDVDAGDILDTEIFELNLFDTAKTAHYKNTLAMIKILKRNMDELLSGSFRLRKQLPVKPTYYPKRTAEDGVIFWDRSSEEIYNLIRAVTKPFPGALSFYKNRKIMIWKAYPFDERLFDSYIMPGTILQVFVNGDLIVKTGTGSIIVTEYETVSKGQLKKGIVLHSGKYQYNNPYQYPT